MIAESITVGSVLAVVISSLTVIILYHYIRREYLGADENAYWNAFRVQVLSTGDSTVRQKTDFILTNSAKDSELIGEVNLSSQEVAQALKDAGYVQCVLSRLKYRLSSDGEGWYPVGE